MTTSNFEGHKQAKRSRFASPKKAVGQVLVLGFVINESPDARNIVCKKLYKSELDSTMKILEAYSEMAKTLRALPYEKTMKTTCEIYFYDVRDFDTTKRRENIETFVGDQFKKLEMWSGHIYQLTQGSSKWVKVHRGLMDYC